MKPVPEEGVLVKDRNALNVPVVSDALLDLESRETAALGPALRPRWLAKFRQTVEGAASGDSPRYDWVICAHAWSWFKQGTGFG